MKFIHNIFIANSFKFGKRIAFDLVLEKEKGEDELEQSNKIQSLLVRIYDDVGKEAVITTHTIITSSRKWHSVCMEDSFFKDVELIKDEDQFINYIKMNNTLTRSIVTAIVVVLLSHKKVDGDTNVEDVVNRIANNYKIQYGKELYDRECLFSDSDKMKDYDHIFKYPTIILDRVLSAKDGFEKFKFIQSEIDEFKA